MIRPETTEALIQHLKFSVEARDRVQEGGFKQLGYFYSCMDDFILQEGQAFTTLAPDQERYQRGVLKHCFTNAFHAAARSRGNLRYVEGMAISNTPIPVHHAWCVNKKGEVVDTTWRGSFLGRPMEGRAYYGVIFSLDEVRSTRTPENQTMLDRWEERWPILLHQRRLDTVAA